MSKEDSPITHSLFESIVDMRKSPEQLNEVVQNISSGGGSKNQEKFESVLRKAINDRQISQVNFRSDDIVSVIFSIPQLSKVSLDKINKSTRGKIVSINGAKGILTVEWEV